MENDSCSIAESKDCENGNDIMFKGAEHVTSLIKTSSSINKTQAEQIFQKFSIDVDFHALNSELIDHFFAAGLPNLHEYKLIVFLQRSLDNKEKDELEKKIQVYKV